MIIWSQALQPQALYSTGGGPAWSSASGQPLLVPLLEAWKPPPLEDHIGPHALIPPSSRGPRKDFKWWEGDKQGRP